MPEGENRYAALESRMDSLKKEWERKQIPYDILSGFFSEFGKMRELSMDFSEKLFRYQF